MMNVSHEEIERSNKIEACEKRIVDMAKAKFELEEKMRLPLKISENEAAYKRSFELYDRIDEAIAGEATALIALVKERKQGL